MDDIQFNASLDALLANESLDVTNTSANNNGTSLFPNNNFMAMMNNNNSNSNSNGVTGAMNDLYSTIPSVGQGLLCTGGGGAQQQQQYATNSVSAQPPFGSSFMTTGGYAPLSTTPSEGTAIATAAGTITATPNNSGTAMFAPHPRGAASVSSRSSYISQDGSTPSTSSKRRSGTGKRRGSHSSDNNSRRMSGTKRARGGSSSNDDMAAVSEDEDEQTRRRQDRNLREQQRSHKITQQIDHLKEVLSSANIQFKPDKYSTLVTVAEFIKQLQERSQLLDQEHKKLLDTVSKTNEIVNEAHLPPSTSSTSSILSSSRTDGSSGMPESSTSALSTSGGSEIYNEEEMMFVRNVDYKSIFFRCGMPLAVASIDGRFLDCNTEFEKVSGYKREELLPLGERAVGSLNPDGVQSINAETSLGSIETLSVPCASQAGDGEGDNATKLTVNTNPSRNLSLFNIMNRDHMKDLFLALSDILKHHQVEKGPDTETKEPQNKDYWTGNVRLNRNTHQEMRMNIVLVRSPEGRAEFFNCYLSPLPTRSSG